MFIESRTPASLLARSCISMTTPTFVRRDDKQVSYAFAAKQGRRGNMEDFTFAQVIHED